MRIIFFIPRKCVYYNNLYSLFQTFLCPKVYMLYSVNYSRVKLNLLPSFFIIFKTFFNLSYSTRSCSRGSNNVVVDGRDLFSMHFISCRVSSHFSVNLTSRFAMYSGLCLHESQFGSFKISSIKSFVENFFFRIITFSSKIYSNVNLLW